MLPIRLPGEGGAVTTKEVASWRFMAPETAETVRAYVPAGVGVAELEEPAVTISVVLAPEAIGVTDAGWKDAVAPAGSPETVGITAAENPFWDVRVTM